MTTRNSSLPETILRAFYEIEEYSGKFPDHKQRRDIIGAAITNASPIPHGPAEFMANQNAADHLAGMLSVWLDAQDGKSFLKTDLQNFIAETLRDHEAKILDRAVKDFCIFEGGKEPTRPVTLRHSFGFRLRRFLFPVPVDRVPEPRLGWSQKILCIESETRWDWRERFAILLSGRTMTKTLLAAAGPIGDHEAKTVCYVLPPKPVHRTDEESELVWP